MLTIGGDFRYTYTIRLNFNLPVGIGSCGNIEDDDFKEDFEEDITALTSVLSIPVIDITDKINDAIDEFCYCEKLGDIELDWRDQNEIEIHLLDEPNFKDIDSLIDSLIDYIKTRTRKYFK